MGEAKEQPGQITRLTQHKALDYPGAPVPLELGELVLRPSRIY